MSSQVGETNEQGVGSTKMDINMPITLDWVKDEVIDVVEKARSLVYKNR